MESQLQPSSRKDQGQGLKLECSSWAKGTQPPHSALTAAWPGPTATLCRSWPQAGAARPLGGAEGVTEPVSASRALTAAMTGSRFICKGKTQCRYRIQYEINRYTYFCYRLPSLIVNLKIDLSVTSICSPSYCQIISNLTPEYGSPFCLSCCIHDPF